MGVQKWLFVKDVAVHVTGWSQPCVVSPPEFIGGLFTWYALRRARPLVPVAAGDNSMWSWSSVVTLFNGFVGVGTSQVHLVAGGAVSRTWQENSHDLLILKESKDFFIYRH